MVDFQAVDVEERKYLVYMLASKVSKVIAGPQHFPLLLTLQLRPTLCNSFLFLLYSYTFRIVLPFIVVVMVTVVDVDVVVDVVVDAVVALATRRNGSLSRNLAVS